jgi:putative ABC transport system permease protein
VTAKLVLENLKNKPMRTLLSVLLIGIPVTLILCLVGLSYGMIQDSQNRTKAIGADIVVRPPNSSLIQMGAAMPQGLVGYFETQPHVKLAIGVVNKMVEGVTLGATGIDLADFQKMNGGFTFVEGGPFKQADDVIVDQYYASENGLHVGDHVKILNLSWRVCGIIQSGKLTRIAFPLKVMQDLNGYLNPPKVSQIYIKLDDPKYTAEVIQKLKSTEGLQDHSIQSIEEFLSLFTMESIPGLKEFVWVIISIGVIIGFAVVCLSMYMAVLQRTREIGILKSLGGSKAFILQIILIEALLMGVAGTILGIGMSFGAWWLIKTLIPASIPMVIVPSWWPIALVITLIGTGLGALYPGLTAANNDPIEALAYE